jgi:hypothetical protein
MNGKFSIVFGVAILATSQFAHAVEFPVSDTAVGHFYACNADGYCEDVEQVFVSIEGCQVGMMPFMAKWIGDHDGFKLKTGRFDCTPREQTRV